MGGKGRRRREKNYRAAHAHGGNSRLPPPPDPGAVDVVPSKLRRLMQLMKQPSESSKDSGSSRDKGIRPGKRKEETKADENKKGADEVTNKKGADEVTNSSTNDKKKRKRKRKDVKDLRFQALDQAGGARKQKRKEYFEARRKKQKKEKKSEISEFPKHEEISFGEIVEAPPRLSFPKGLKTVHDASHERRRLHVIEAYRSHKGWESRPGIHLPSITETLFP